MRSVCSSTDRVEPPALKSGCSGASSVRRTAARTARGAADAVGRRHRAIPSPGGHRVAGQPPNTPRAACARRPASRHGRRHAPDAVFGHVVGGHAGVHQDVRQRGGLGGGVVAVDVVRGIGFGVPFGLDVGEGVGKADALAHRVEDVVSGRVEHGREAQQAATGQARVEEAEDRAAVHDGALELQTTAPGHGEVGEAPVVPGDRSLIDGDHVHTMVEALLRGGRSPGDRREDRAGSPRRAGRRRRR